MTLFGWDMSSFDGTIGATTAARARAEGIVFATHRLLRQGNVVDGNAARNLAALRDAGVEFLGAYGVVSSGEAVPDADRLVAMADQQVPWWRSFPGWFWQVDLEKWPSDPVPPADGIACARRLRATTGRWTVLYASHGQYGDSLTAWDGALWNANYGNNPVGPFKAVYPGDSSSRWAPYSARVPLLLQYGSNTTIAGLSTCDANAYRGTLEQLRALISGGTMATDINLGQDVPNAVGADGRHHSVGDILGDMEKRTAVLVDGQAALAAKLDAVQAVDPAALAAALAAQPGFVEALAAAVPAPPTAGQIADELAKRLGNG